VLLRFCLALSGSGWARAHDPAAAVARTVELGRLADEAGLDSVWVGEDPDGCDAFAVLGALARATQRVRLGPGVTNPYLRHPNLMAGSVATLDRLSGGRAFLGLGRGQTEWYERSLGIGTGKPLAVLEETIGLLRSWWTEPFRAASASGGGSSHFGVEGWTRSFGPLQARPPIYLAAVGPKALALAGRLADGVLFNEMASPTFIGKAIQLARAAARDAGRDPAALSFFARAGVLVTEDPEPVLERRKETIAFIHALPGMERLMETPGFDTERIIAGVRRAMRTEEVLARGGGFPELRAVGDLAAAKRAIPIELVDRLTIVGSKAHVRERLAELARLSVSHAFVAPPRKLVDALSFAGMIRNLDADGG
jgi:5,10-methylenetetrahydromethanopterin reductase